MQKSEADIEIYEKQLEEIKSSIQKIDTEISEMYESVKRFDEETEELRSRENDEIHEEWRGGKQIGAVANGGVYKDWSGGSFIGNARDYIIHGLEHNEPAMVACWHFLIRKIF